MLLSLLEVAPKMPVCGLLSFGATTTLFGSFGLAATVTSDWSSLKFSNEGEILAGHADPDRAYAELIRPEKMRLGLEYARRGKFRDDIDILVKTVLLPFRK